MHLIHHIHATETGRHAFLKFLLVFSVFLLYALFVIQRYGAEEGIIVALLTWSFFVFCTPIADAGFLLAFPIRLISNVRMIYTQALAYLIALLILSYAMVFTPSAFDNTLILKLYKEIITHPFPYYVIIVLSMIGTFASIIFADELMDVASHKERKHFHAHHPKYELVATLAIIALTVAFYKLLIDSLDIPIHLV